MKTHLIPALLFTLVATAAGAHDYKLGSLVNSPVFGRDWT